MKSLDADATPDAEGHARNIQFHVTQQMSIGIDHSMENRYKRDSRLPFERYQASK